MPTCPKWTLADLVDHVGATRRMVTMLVVERMDVPVWDPSGDAAGVPFWSRPTRPANGWPAASRTGWPLNATPSLDVHGDRTLFTHWIEHMDRVTD